MAQTLETVSKSFTDDMGNVQTIQEQQPQAVCIRFLMHMVE